MDRLIVKARRVFSATGAPTMENAIIMIEGNRIAAVGRESEFSGSLDGAEIIDAGDRTILPGLMDMHTHLCVWTHSWDPRALLSEMHESAEAISATTISGVRNCRNFITHGITTIRDVGCRHSGVFVLKRLCETDDLVGPRIFAAGQAIGITGGHGRTVGIEVDGPDAVRAAARRQIKAGADLIKLMVTGPGAEATSPYEAQMTVPEIAAATEEAHQRGRTVCCHAVNAEGAMNAIHGGIDCIEHGLLLDDKTLKEMEARKIFWCPTLWTYQNTAWHGADYGTEEWIVRRVQRTTEQHLRNFQKAMGYGVKIAAGTDSGLPLNPPRSLVWELEWYVRLGMRPTDAICTATRSASELLRKKDDLGTLEPGKYADVIVVDGDPTKNITDLHNVWLVIKNGKVVVQKGRPDSFDQEVTVGQQANPDDWQERLAISSAAQ